MKENITKRRRGYSKQITPKQAIAEMSRLRKQLSKIENQVFIKEDKSLINITKEIKVAFRFDRAKVWGLEFYHRCWCVGLCNLRDFPENFETSNKHYIIQWEDDEFRILWDGKWGFK